MLYGILSMPYEMAMSDELSRFQFYKTVQKLLEKDSQQQAEIEALKKLAHQRFDDGKRLGIIETEDRLRKASEKCNHSNFVKTEHLTGEGPMEYVEWFDNTCSDCGKHWTTNN